MEEESGIADADVEDLEDAGEDEQAGVLCRLAMRLNLSLGFDLATSAVFSFVQDAGEEYQDGDLEKALEEVRNTRDFCGSADWSLTRRKQWRRKS